MKNIVLTSVILFLSVHLNLNSNRHMVGAPFTANIAANEVLNGDTMQFEKVDSFVTKNNEFKKTTGNHSKKEKGKKSRRPQLLNKLNPLNQSNIQLHKKMSEAGRFAEKGSVQFNFDQHNIKNIEAFNHIMRIADQLLFDSTKQVSIAGYTDNIGGTYYNDVLSYKRAENVKDYLVELGVSETQIHLSFNGMTDPVSDNDQESGRAENRRVEFVVFSAG